MTLTAKSPIATIEATVLTQTYGRFVVEPLESGFGVTLGNAMRRVLLSSLSGAAVTSVRIEGLEHEFSTIPYMKEDTIEFLLNVKGLRLRYVSDRPGRLTLEVDGEGEITAADIVPSADYEIANPELHLATLGSPEARLYAEFSVEQGKGYVPADQGDNLPIGTIPIDAIFTPIRRANYTVERTRVGQLTNYDKLTLEVWTDGTIAPQEAVGKAARILIEQFTIFAHTGVPPGQRWDRVSRAALALTPEQYNMPIRNLGLSVRTNNCLQRSSITTLGQVVQMTEDDLLAVKNFGRKSLEELTGRLALLGLSLAGAKVPEVKAPRLEEAAIEEGEELVAEDLEELPESFAPLAWEEEALELGDLEEFSEEEIEPVDEATAEKDEALLLEEMEEPEEPISPIAVALARARARAARIEKGDDGEPTGVSRAT